MKWNSSVTHESKQGARSYQEDRVETGCNYPYFPELNDWCIWTLAVYDGHGGSEAVSKCVSRMMFYLWNRPWGNTRVNIPNVLRRAFAQVDKDTRSIESGSTASVVIVHKKRKKAYVAILGDSPVVIFDRMGTVSVSPEHNVRVNAQERKRAVARGLVYEDGYIVNPATGTKFGLSRAFGDAEFDSVLVREPELYTVDLGPESFIIVASDGVFDPAHYDTHAQARRIAQKVKGGWEAEDVVQDALERQTEDNATGDNATAIVWRANRERSNSPILRKRIEEAAAFDK